MNQVWVAIGLGFLKRRAVRLSRLGTELSYPLFRSAIFCLAMISGEFFDSGLILRSQLSALFYKLLDVFLRGTLAIHDSSF